MPNAEPANLSADRDTNPPSPATTTHPATRESSVIAADEVSPPRSFRRGGIILALGVVALGAWIGLRVKAATGKQKAVATARQQVAEEAAAAATRPPVVSTVFGEPAVVRPEVRLEGTLSPVREADLAFKAAGRIAKIRVKVGDHVREGTILATLDAREATAQLAAAKAQLAAAEAQLVLATDAARRTEAVVTSGAQPEAVGVQTRQQKALAEAQREAARAQVALAETALANHTLTAPFAGTVSRVPPGPGGVVAPGIPQFHVADYDTLKLVGTVSAADATLVRPGAVVKVKRPAGVAANNGADHVAGKVIAVVSALDAATKRVPVEAEVTNDRKDPLLAGTLVRATVLASGDVKVVRLPGTALRPGSQDEVLVVAGGANGGRLEIRQVDLDVASDGALIVRRGLEPGEAVVARPWPEAKTGDRVTVASAKSTTATTVEPLPKPRAGAAR